MFFEYLITIKTRPTQIVKVNVLLKKRFLMCFFKDYWCTKLTTYHFLSIFNAQ